MASPTFLGDQQTALQALRRMNSDLLKYPILKDIKLLERDEIVRRAAEFRRAGVLLDVGCGLGEDMYAIADRINGRVVGIDYNPLAIANCPPHPKLEFRVMDARKIEFPDAAFDLAYITVNTLGNFGLMERHAWLKEILRVSGMTLVSLYPNTGDQEAMGIPSRLQYYHDLVDSDVIFDGHTFSCRSRGWVGRLFALEEIAEMFRAYGIRDYELTRLSEILLSVAIPAQRLPDRPDTSGINLLSWDM